MKTITQTLKLVLAIVMLLTVTQLVSCKKDEKEIIDPREIKIKLYKSANLNEAIFSSITWKIADPMTGKALSGESARAVAENADANTCQNTYTMPGLQLTRGGIDIIITATYTRSPQAPRVVETYTSVSIPFEWESGCYKIFISDGGTEGGMQTSIEDQIY